MDSRLDSCGSDKGAKQSVLLSLIMKSIYLFLIFSFLSPLCLASDITGKIKFEGEKPKPKKVSAKSDPRCMREHGQPILDEALVVGKSNGIKNAFIYIKTGLEGKTFPVPEQPVVLDQKGCVYLPHVFGIMVNQKLEIRNSDPTLHNVRSLPKNSKGFNVGLPIKGMKLDQTFTSPEVMIRLKCDVHPWMHAYAGVLAHPFYAVSNSEGNFEIKNLPPGNYELEVWHETLGVQTRKMIIADQGSTTADFTFRK